MDSRPLVFMSLVTLVLMNECAAGTVWTIRLRSHPYKTELYTAEFIKDPWRYFWCADYIRQEDAVVLCNQMSQYNGLGPYDVASSRLEFGALQYDPGVPEAFTNETFACVGTEARLSDCPTAPVEERCPSGNLGQVDCNPADNARKNLTFSLNSRAGLTDKGVVEAENPSLRGMSGLICDETGLWSDSEATVACRSLGYGGSLAFVTDPEVVSNASTLNQHYVIKNVRCQGSEQSLNDCPHTDMCMAIDFLDKSFECPEHCDGEAAAVVCA